MKTLETTRKMVGYLLQIEDTRWSKRLLKWTSPGRSKGGKL